MKNKIKSFEDACNALGINAVEPDFSAMPEKHRKALLAHYKLVIIAEAFNEGWKPDWYNSSEYKYYPWFDMSPEGQEHTGCGFSFNVCDFDTSGTTVGSRLCYKSRELAEYAGKQFEELYKDYFLL